MANRTDTSALQVHGTDPQFLIEKILRERIHTSNYWKAYCFGLNAETILEEVAKLKCIGGMIGVGGEGAASNFLCLLLKLLQIQPAADVIEHYIQQNDLKLLRILGAFYLRLTGSSLDIYKSLEPLYYDCRAIYYQLSNGKFQRVFMDECIHELFKREKFCDVSLPKIAKREVLEEQGKLQPRESVIVPMTETETAGQNLDAMEEEPIHTAAKTAGEQESKIRTGEQTAAVTNATSANNNNTKPDAGETGKDSVGEKVVRRRENCRVLKRSRGRSESHSRSRSRSRSESHGRSRKHHSRRHGRSRSRSHSRGRHGRRGRHHRSHSPSSASSASRSPGRKQEETQLTKIVDKKEEKQQNGQDKAMKKERHRHHGGHHRGHHHRSRSSSRSRSRSNSRDGSRSRSRRHSHHRDYAKDRTQRRESEDPRSLSNANGSHGKDEMRSDNH